MKNPFIILFLIIFFIVALHKNFPENINYPFSTQDAVIDKYFDTTIVDPYRWLEDDYSSKTESWVEKQNAVTNRYLRKIPYRKEKRSFKLKILKMVLLARIELAASPLPRECSTTELQQLQNSFSLIF